MDLDIEVCRTIAIQNGLPLQFVIKEFYLMDALAQVTRQVSANPEELVFKGGTALSKVYLQKMQRFSEDLDFDLVTKDAKADLRTFCKSVAAGMEGFGIDEFRKVHDTVQFYCRYETPLGGTDHIRIDISPRKLVTAMPIEIRPAVSEFTKASVTGFRVYALEDLTARKINALASRAEGKDIYDVYSAVALCDHHTLKRAISREIESEGKNLKANELIRKAEAALEKKDMRKIQSLTNPFIPSARRPRNWAELRDDLRIKLDALVTES